MIKYELSENEKEWLKHAEEITDTNYEIGNDNYISVENLINTIIDLVTEYERLEEQHDSYKEFVKDNYKQKTLEESYR